MATEAINRIQSSRRRSTRIALNTTVLLLGEDPGKTLDATATNLNKHGAAIQLTAELPVGSTILVRNKQGIQASARVVSQIKAVAGLRTYGIEFVEQQSDWVKTFWGITFPSLA